MMKISKRTLLLLSLPLFALIQGCASGPGVASSEGFKPGEGLVAVRLINVSSMPFGAMTVVSESGESFMLTTQRFGQFGSAMIVGTLPAGRYRPTALHGYQSSSGPLTAPIAKQTGRFVVEPSRATELGTLIAMPSRDPESQALGTPYDVMIDPTPVPLQPLVQRRLPGLAMAVSAKPPLGWQAGTVPQQTPKRLDNERAELLGSVNPLFLDGGRMLAGVALGGVVERLPAGTRRTHSTGTVHQIHTVVTVGSQRLLAGGEEGFVAVSDDGGATWRRTPGPTPEELVLFAAKGSNQKLYLVTALDDATVVYESAAQPVEWKPIRRIVSERRSEIIHGPAPRDSAAMTAERLVVYTKPGLLSSLDLRSGQWEEAKTPLRSFNAGLQATPDGYVIGIVGPMWMYGSLDYGRTWTRLEGWLHTSMPAFVDRNRGYLVSADATLIGGKRDFQVRRTDDGGKTWASLGAAGGHWSWLTPLLLAPLWVSGDGTSLYTVEGRNIVASKDQGKTWR